MSTPDNDSESYNNKLPVLTVGARVQYESSIGTVRYVGPLRGRDTSLVWVGVEWDDARRGKHSGMHDGHHYFTTTVPNAGSFVKLSKLSPRRSLVDAARLRHADALDVSHRTMPQYVRGGRLFEIAEEGQRVDTLAEVTHLDLSLMGVCSVAGVVNQQQAQHALNATVITDTLANVRELTLISSLFTRVSDVLDVLHALPLLTMLDVSKNVFRFDGDGDDVVHGSETNAGGGKETIVKNTEHGEGQEKSKKHQHLTQLILNHCAVSWQSVRKMCSHVQALEELRLHNCNLASFCLINKDESNNNVSCNDITEHWQALRILDLDENRITWTDVSRLAPLPHLRHLYISSNELPNCSDPATTLGSPANDSVPPTVTSTPFPSLHTLSVERNALSDWQLITWLHNLETLRHLRAGGNKALQKQQGNYRLRTIARVGHVVCVDGTNVSVDERLQAERRYVRDEIGPAVRTLGMSAAEKTHVRARELFDMYADTVGITRGAGGGRRPGLSPSGADGAAAETATATMRHSAVRCALQITVAAIGNDMAVEAGRHRAMRVLPMSIDTERIEAVVRTVLRIRDKQRRIRLRVSVTDLDKHNNNGDASCSKVSAQRAVHMTDGLVLGTVLGTHFDAVTIDCIGLYDR